MLRRFHPPFERRGHSITDVRKPYKSVVVLRLFRLIIFILERVAPNNPRLLVLSVAFLLAVAALIQTIGGDDSANSPDSKAVSSSSSQGTYEASSVTESGLNALTTVSSTTVAPTLSESPSTTSVPHPVTSISIGNGALRISGHGSDVVSVGDEWMSYRTAIYRGTDSDSALLIELREGETVIASFGYLDAAADRSDIGNWTIQGIRWLEDITQGVEEIAVTTSSGWEIDLLPESFLWNQQIEAGNPPRAADRFLFSSQGLNFVGLGHEGTGDFMIYNACEGPCNEEKTVWSIELHSDCRANSPDLFVRSAGSPFFELISYQDPRVTSTREKIEIALDNYDWLQVLTPCQWGATYS